MTVPSALPLLRRFAALAISSTALVLAACEGSGQSTVTSTPQEDGTSSLLLEPPEPVLLARAVVRENLSLSVQVETEGATEEINASRQQNGLWAGTLRLPRNRTFTVTVTWSERIEDTLVGLARATKTDTVPDDGSPYSVRIFSTEFDFSASLFDEDEDGLSNLDERRAESDVFRRDEPQTPTVSVPLTIAFALPGALREVDPSVLDELDVRVLVNRRVVPITRAANGGWLGTMEVNQDASVFASVSIFDSSEQRVVVATAQRGDIDTSGNAPTATFESDDYQIRNDDGDELTNIEELIGGSNPFDSNDPPPDPCEVSNFEPGCAVDTDGDGRPDSRETAEADRDDDGRPDYTESSLVDADEDGRAADVDPDEGDACVPSTDNAPCRSTLDDDDDGVTNPRDNCRAVPNSDQRDTDDDGLGDLCDTSDDRDDDEDGVANVRDNCPNDANADQRDEDGDGNGDVCDELDDRDPDEDGVLENVDNCPSVPNPDQEDIDNDGQGDACDTSDDRDDDDDGVADTLDNCPDDPNPDQSDVDEDGAGDVCDTSDDRDRDDDGVADTLDNCPDDPNPDQGDLDEDGAGDVCDTSDDRDSDDDGIADLLDNCPDDPNPDQSELDEDGIGDVCDTSDDRDRDDDGVADLLDNCPDDPNPDQADADGDGEGDVCDATADIEDET